MRNWYPNKLAVGGKADKRVIQNISSVFSRKDVFTYAEFGIYEGATAFKIAKLFPNSSIHLFDYDHQLDKVRIRFTSLPNQVHFHGNSHRFMDSYNWSLAGILRDNPLGNLFDYCFLDGAHTFAVDGLAFFLIDRLLRVGGFIEFDDADWALRGSSLDPDRVSETALMFTDEQIDALQIQMVLDLLVKPSGRFFEISTDRLFRKET